MHAASGDFSIIIYSALLLEYLLKNTNNLHKNIKMSVQIVITTLLFAMYYQNPFNLGKKSIESVKKKHHSISGVINLRNWWTPWDLNPGPTDYESAALTAELGVQTAYFSIIQWLNLTVNS